MSNYDYTDYAQLKTCAQRLTEIRDDVPLLVSALDLRNQIELAKLAEMRAARSVQNAILITLKRVNSLPSEGVTSRTADRLSAALLDEPTNPNTKP